MAGVGKTTLVEQVYSDPRAMDRYELRLFLKIGPQYKSSKEILLLVARELGFRSEEDVSLEQLERYLDRSLQLTRHLIVLDDMWSSEDLDDIASNFPCCSTSCVIVITQIRSLTSPFHENVLEIPLLNDEESWSLLRENVFTSDELCGSRLERIGKKIAKKCEGLPLAIIQVGGLLRGTPVEEWETIAEQEDPLIVTMDDNTPLSRAISLSYMMLPQYLKVCFLYMGVFPKYYEIPRSKLVKLMVSEGILGPEDSKEYLEEIGGESLDELVFRSVVRNNKLRSLGTGTPKTCSLHFTFRTLCVSEATRERFFHIIKKYHHSFPESMSNQHRLCVQNNVVLGFEQVREWMETAPDARSLLCVGPKQRYPVVLYLGFRLLKVLEALAIRFYEFPRQVLELLHLRHLAITCDRDLPRCISRLWNLESLIVHQHHNIKRSSAPVYLPVEIWDLHQLKHLECTGFDLPDPPPSDESLILGKLQTLSGVTAASCTRGVLARLPSLNKVGIKIESAHDSVETLSFIGEFASLYQEFESFKCFVINPNLGSPVVPPVPCFPEYIRKISLSGCGLPWEYMRVIAVLPNLQVLKLRWRAFCGPKWIMNEDKDEIEEFPRLEFLLLEDLDVQQWEAEKIDFLELRRLIVRHCYRLQQIPKGFELRGTLDMIEVDDCSPSVALSAQAIKQQQSMFRNEESLNNNRELHTRLHFSGDDL